MTMGQRSILDVSSPPKAASSAATHAVSSDPSPSPAPAGEVSGPAVSGLGPWAAVAATVPPGGIVPPAPPFVAPAGGFGPPSFLVAPPPAPASTVRAAPAAAGVNAGGGGSAAGRGLTLPEPAPPPPGWMTWAALQAELLDLKPNMVGRQNLCVPLWPVGEPLYERIHKRIQRWHEVLQVAVEHFDMLSISLHPNTRLRRLVVALWNRYVLP
ncbi:hypothetical protein AURDEDRAFT_165673 [Auricularia subglabra TFB-10046 SS5]|nr:hypothetical protein AURDEDRAFT_165673 [Auricularia subglabra TFB-10046 SS5]